MKTRQEIAVARHMAAAHTAVYDLSPYQMAVLYGIKTALGLEGFEWPKDKHTWTMLLQTICEQYKGDKFWDFRHRIPRHPFGQDHTQLDWLLFREFANSVHRWMAIPEPHEPILQGIRIACAWVLELPRGGQALQRLWDGEITAAAVGRNAGQSPLVSLVERNGSS